MAQDDTVWKDCQLKRLACLIEERNLLPHSIPIRHGLWRAIRRLPNQGSKGLFSCAPLGISHFAKVGQLTSKIR